MESGSHVYCDGALAHSSLATADRYNPLDSQQVALAAELLLLGLGGQSDVDVAESLDLELALDHSLDPAVVLVEVESNTYLACFVYLMRGYHPCAEETLLLALV